jgi:hypothetical protein
LDLDLRALDLDLRSLLLARDFPDLAHGRHRRRECSKQEQTAEQN